MTEAPEIILCTPACHVGTWRSLVLVCWGSETNATGVDAIRKALENVCAANPNGVGIIVQIDLRSKPPGKEMRDQLAALQTAFPAVRASANVVSGKGLAVATARSVIAGMMLLARSETPQRVFATTHEAASWIAPFVPGLANVTPDEIASAVESLRVA